MPVTHLTTTFITSRQKTATTLCGKKVAASQIALDSDATCPQCRASADQAHSSVKQMVEYAGTVLSANDKALADARAYAAEPVSYRSARFL